MSATISLHVVCNVTNFQNVGDLLTYTYTATNTTQSNLPSPIFGVGSIYVTDTLNVVTLNPSDNFIGNGSSVSGTATYTIVQV